MISSEKSVTEKIKDNPDGSKTISLSLTPEQAATFFAACNLVSEELGRPVSKAEAVSYMIEQVLKDQTS